MRAVLTALALVLAACGPDTTTLSGTSPSPSAPRFTPIVSPSPASPTRLPGSVVRLSVNGVEHPVSTEILDPGDGPVTILLTFPFAVDRVSVLEWGGLPEARTWLDDRTLRLVVPENAPSLSFKIAQTKSANGDVVIDQFIVSVTFPGTRVVSVYTIADLTNARPPQPSSSWRIRSDDGMTLSPDAKRVLIYDTIGPPAGQVPTFIELDTKTRTTLTQPPASDGWFAFADWMTDGRLVIVGRGVWVGDANAGGMKRIADAQAVVDGYPWVALPDPAQKRLALWGYNNDGRIGVVDLATGIAQRVTGPFRRCAADASSSLAWSADGRLLAGTDCDREEGPAKGRVRIVDVAADRTVRTIEGGAIWVSGLANGSFMLVRDSGEVGAGQRLLGLMLAFDGQEQGRFLGHGWLMSSDRRYLLQVRFQPAGGPDYVMFDSVAGRSFEFNVPCGGRSDGRCPDPHWMRDGRLAFF